MRRLNVNDFPLFDGVVSPFGNSRNDYYWLASPSNGNGERGRDVFPSVGRIGFDDITTYTSPNLKPVVCLNENVNVKIKK